jgi:serine protease Do
MMGGPSWLGVTLSDVDAEKMRELKLSGEYGVVIENVSEESPAARAGLQKGDIIVSFGGERVRSVTQITRLVRETPAGRKVAVEIVRAGQARTVEVTPETRRARWATPDIHISPMPEMARGRCRTSTSSLSGAAGAAGRLGG